MKQLSKEAAITLHNSFMWRGWTDEEIVMAQLYQDRLFIPPEYYYKALNKVLGRPVLTHEYRFPQNLIAEYEGKRQPPTFQEILALMPKNIKVMVV